MTKTTQVQSKHDYQELEVDPVSGWSGSFGSLFRYCRELLIILSLCQTAEVYKSSIRTLTPLNESPYNSADISSDFEA